MSNNDKIFKPRRGTKSTFTGNGTGNKKSTVLSEGEVFFEVPDTGQGTGRGRLKMGDGSSTYATLPYFLPFTEDEIINHSGTDDKTITASSSIQSTGVATNLNNAKSGNTLKTIIHNLREAIYKCACDISYLDNKAGGSYIGMIIYSTVLDTSTKVIAQYGGTSWISLSGYVLRGATSSVTANNNAKDGGSDDLIIPYHNHSFTGTAKNYTSGVESSDHTHSGTTGNDAPGHTHSITGGSHCHAIGGNAIIFGNPGGINLVNYGDVPFMLASTTNATTAYENGHTHTCGDRSAYHQHSFTTGGISANHTHTTSVTPEGSVGYAGTNGNTTNANLPNYKNVYIWERTA